MTRRAAVIAGLVAFCRGLEAQQQKPDVKELKLSPVELKVTAAFDLTVTGKYEYFLIVNADGREARLTAKDIMDALIEPAPWWKRRLW